MNQGTHWNLIDPKMDPAGLILGDPCSKKAFRGPFKVHISKKMEKLRFTAWFEVNPIFVSTDIAF